MKSERLNFNLKNELSSLFDQHKEEVGSFGDIPVDPDWRTYTKLCDVGLVHILTLRHTLELVGYYIVMINRHLHYNIIIAENDIVFIRPDHRGMIAVRFLKWIDAYLKRQGVNYAHVGVKPIRDFSPILKRMGYKTMEVRYYKELQ